MTKLPEVGGKYGAPMGRASHATPGDTVDCTITRCNIDSGGYDSGGAYWGTGQPVYWISGDGINLYIRAKSARAAKAEATSRHNVRFT